MSTIQKALATVRELISEEIDLVGGAWSAEPTFSLTQSAQKYCTPFACYSVSVPDDSSTDLTFD